MRKRSASAIAELLTKRQSLIMANHQSNVATAFVTRFDPIPEKQEEEKTTEEQETPEEE
jgi:hypothetical protein